MNDDATVWQMTPAAIDTIGACMVKLGFEKRRVIRLTKARVFWVSSSRFAETRFAEKNRTRHLQLHV